MTLKDLKPFIDKLGKYDKLCVFDKKKGFLIDTIFINPIDNKLYEFISIFSDMQQVLYQIALFDNSHLSLYSNRHKSLDL